MVKGNLERVKIVKTEVLIDAAGFSATAEWVTIRRHIITSIQAVEWPLGSGSFTLYDEPGKKRGQGSGVKPIKEAFVLNLKKLGWDLETKVDIAARTKPGPFDATYKVREKLFAVEWETGNISSSHRAMNKMALGLLKGILIGGVLILPTRQMYRYLTDRVGNLQELEPYFPFWRALNCQEGLLAVIAIEHDAVSKKVRRIRKGTSGRALQ
jgi:hypothetical protein